MLLASTNQQRRHWTPRCFSPRAGDLVSFGAEAWSGFGRWRRTDIQRVLWNSCRWRDFKNKHFFSSHSVSGRKQHDIQMMFNIPIDGSSFSKNFEDFDSIRSVLLYRSVKPLSKWSQSATNDLCKGQIVLYCQRLPEYQRGFKSLMRFCVEAEARASIKHHYVSHILCVWYFNFVVSFWYIRTVISMKY